MNFRDFRATLEIDLSKKIDKLWENLDKDARWGIKKAKKCELSVDILNSDDKRFDEFYEIYKETIMRGGITPSEKEVLQNETDKLFICSKEGDIIAGAAIKLLNNKTELFLNASKFEYLKFQPNNLLYWKIIEWSKENGFQVFDLGGYQIGSKKGDKLYHVNRFKERWGGEIKKYEIKSKNPFYIIGRKIIRNFGIIKKSKDAGKVWLYKNREVFQKIKTKLNTLFNAIIYDQREILVFSNMSGTDIPLIRPEVELKKKNINLEEAMAQKRKGYPFTKKMKERFDKGDLCFTYIDSDEVLHSSWVCFEEMDISETKTKIPLKKYQACIYDCYTPQNYRKKGLYSSMLAEIKKELFKKDIKKIYIYVDSKNISSIKGINKAGFKEDFSIKYFNLFGFKKQSIIKFKKED